MAGAATRPLVLILAPSNLGLRPHADGREQGAWAAPAVLLDAGLAEALGASRVIALDRPPYDPAPLPGTTILNGPAIRRFALELGARVGEALAAGALPDVVGGACSILLGCLHGQRRAGGRGLVHVDGHSDFFHPGNSAMRQGPASAAGMDLALATGRGETVLSDWPDVEGPLVVDADAVQIGERDALSEEFRDGYGDIAATAITRFIVQDVLAGGIAATAERTLDRLAARGLDAAWLHVDFDVLDETVLPAVDSPGRPGLDFALLSELIAMLAGSGRVQGADFTIYDPERDPQRMYAQPLVACVTQGLAHMK